MAIVRQNDSNKTIVAGTKVALGSDTAGDIYYLVGGVLTRLPIGANGSYFSVSAGVPEWTTTNTPSGAIASGDLAGSSYPNPSIAAQAVTYSKIQNVSTARFLGRVTAGSGTVEELTASQGRTLFALGTAAVLDTGLLSGNIPLIGAGNVLDPAIIPKTAITSVQPVANQAVRLALTTAPDGSAISIGDVAKQTDNGIAYMLSALPASTDGNWISIGDTAIDAADIASGVIIPARLGTGTANSSTFLRGDGTYATVSTSTPTTEFTGTTGALTGTGIFIANRAASLCDMTLPAVAVQGTKIQIVGLGAGGWRISQNANQLVYFGDQVSITGTTGYVASSQARDCVTLVCVVANTTWVVQSSIGNLDVNV